MIWKIGIRKRNEVNYSPIEYVFVESSDLGQAVNKVQNEYPNYTVASMYEENAIGILHE